MFDTSSLVKSARLQWLKPLASYYRSTPLHSGPSQITHTPPSTYLSGQLSVSHTLTELTGNDGRKKKEVRKKRSIFGAKCHFYLLEAKGAGVCQQRGRQMAHGCELEIGWHAIYLTETENLQHLDVCNRKRVGCA